MKGMPLAQIRISYDKFVEVLHQQTILSHLATNASSGLSNNTCRHITTGLSCSQPWGGATNLRIVDGLCNICQGRTSKQTWLCRRDCKCFVVTLQVTICLGGAWRSNVGSNVFILAWKSKSTLQWTNKIFPLPSERTKLIQWHEKNGEKGFCKEEKFLHGKDPFNIFASVNWWPSKCSGRNDAYFTLRLSYTCITRLLQTYSWSCFTTGY